MKKSIKILIGGACLVLLALVYYDLMVREAFMAGTYKKPFNTFTTLTYENFDEIDLSAATAANIIVQQGPFSVKMDPTAAGFVKVSQTSNTLHIDAAFSDHYYSPLSNYVLIITCPHLLKFSSDSKYTAGGTPVTDTLASEDFKWRPTIIEGFNADSLVVSETHASSVILKKDHIRSLKIVMGIGDKSRSNLVITDDNQFGKADIDIRNKSQLRLECTHIQNLSYRLADSARLIVTGTTQNMIKK
jgi:hypothetical protein